MAEKASGENPNAASEQRWLRADDDYSDDDDDDDDYGGDDDDDDDDVDRWSMEVRDTLGGGRGRGAAAGGGRA